MPIRQWVLTLPYSLRFLLAYDGSLVTAVLNAFLKAVFGHLKRRAKDYLGLRSVKQAMPGAITVIQRAGSALNLNVHFHSLITDGVFIVEDSGETVFRALPAPDEMDIQEVAQETCLRTIALLKKRGMWEDEEVVFCEESDDGLSQLAARSIHGRIALGARAGKRVARIFGVSATGDDFDARSRAVYGFNLHAKRRVSAHDRKDLERLCRYVLRPPISNDRLRRRADGQIELKLKRAFKNGTTHMMLSSLELVEKLASLIPPPRFHRFRYHGVFAPNSGLRQAVVPQTAKPTKDAANDDCCAAAKRKRYTWARLLARIFSIDVFACPRCKADMQQIAAIIENDAIRRILDCVGLPADSPETAPSTLHRQLEFEEYVDFEAFA